jgi:hypothetical protein
VACPVEEPEPAGTLARLEVFPEVPPPLGLVDPD